MKDLRARLLAVVAPAGGGPRKRTVLDALFGAELVTQMIRAKELGRYSDKRHALWGLPKRRRR